ncbi:MAG: hypothetical protein GKR93_01335 [Gammaproteobacteria bacterium]|nr:hypothetical protein [Gammaproteobacteria bacterium]
MIILDKTLHAVILLICVLLLATSSMNTHARQFRQVIPIATPNKSAATLPEGAVAIEKPRELGREEVKDAVNQVLSKWNTGNLSEVLSESFFDKTRLTDAVDNIAPRDATLSIQSVQGIQTLQQFIMPGEDGDSMVSIVSATVRTQLEYNDPESGFVRLPGVNEFVLKVTQPVSQ